MLKTEQSPDFAATWLEHRALTACTHETLLYPELIRKIGDIKGLRVCDLGCGEGSFLKVLGEQDPLSLVGLEINNELVRQAATNTKNIARIMCVDISRGWPLQDKSVDRLVSSNAIMHLSENEADKFFAEAARVLKPDGIFTLAHVHIGWAKSKYSLTEVAGHKGVYERDISESRFNISEYYRTFDAIANLARQYGLAATERDVVFIKDVEGLVENHRTNAGSALFEVINLTSE